jgi:amino acid permease
VLALPYVCKLCGVALGLIMLFSGYLATLWSFNLLISANIQTGGSKSFKDFYAKCGGRRLYLAYDFVVTLTIFGSLIGYQVIGNIYIFTYLIVSEMIQGVLQSADFDDDERAYYKPYHIVATSAVIVFPVCLLRSVDSFRYATLLSIGAIVYTSLILIIELPFYLTDDKTIINIQYFIFDLNFFKAFGLTFFAFYCQIGFFPAIENLVKLDLKHIKKVKWIK